MILIDTSVWIDHFRSTSAVLSDLLYAEEVMTHPFVIGELACGMLRQRSEVLRLLGNLRRATVATHEEVMHLIEERRLMGRGIGYVDVHLLAAVSLTPGTHLWTRDKALATVAADLGLGLTR